MKQLYLRMALASLFFCLYLGMSAQNVGINEDNSVPDPNAMLDVKSTTKGALFPRMTTAQRTTLGNANPAEGMLVFDTEVEAFFYFTNGSWAQLSTGNSSSIVPVGTILAYGDDTPPPGYLICDGSSVNNVTYHDLFMAIGTNWGGDGTPNFKLPDLRGRFPRGWNNGAGVDPNATARTDVNGIPLPANESDVVGSYQEDEFRAHNHTQRYDNVNTRSSGTLTWHTPAGAGHAGAQTDAAGGSETRPKNAYVLYIIKY